MFSYEVLSESEAAAERFMLLKEGEYDAIVEASQDKISANSGNPMMDMTLTVYDENGKGHAVRDFLVFTKGTMWKVIHFAKSAGIMHAYEDEKLCSEVALGKSVRVKIGIEQGSEIPSDRLNGKPQGAKYPDKNKVIAYIQPDETPSSSKKEEVEFVDDDVPF